MILVWRDFLFILAHWYLSKSDCGGETSQAVCSNSFFHILILLPIVKPMPCLPLRIWVVTQCTNCGIRLAIWVSSCELQWSFLVPFNHIEYASNSGFCLWKRVAFLVPALLLFFSKIFYGRELIIYHEITKFTKGKLQPFRTKLPCWLRKYGLRGKRKKNIL